MKKVNFYRKPISMTVAVAFMVMLCFWSNPSPAAAAAPAAEKSSAAALEKATAESPGYIEQEDNDPVVKKGKKFPWLLVAAAVVVGGAAIYFFTVVNKKYTLTVDVGEGVSGIPTTGAAKYKKGSDASYSYSLASGYTNLEVTLDGAAIAASGTVKMNGNHTLRARATKSYALAVIRGLGVSGIPVTGTYTYASGASVNYSYATASGYTGLVVKLDGISVAASGTITMDANHTLTASATQGYTLTVSKGANVIGSPNSGTYSCESGATIAYSYAPASGYNTLEVKVDNVVVPNSGTIIMNANHSLTVKASKSYILTVSKGAHVIGSPNSGSYTYAGGSFVSYSYAPESGYTHLEVKLDGVAVAASGTITMNANHTLTANLGGATLVVNSTPSGARIYRDNVDTGFTTPHTFFSNAAISTTVHLRAATCGYCEHHQDVSVAVGQTTVLNITLTSGIHEDFGIPASLCWQPYYASEWSIFAGHYRYKGAAAGGSTSVYTHPFSGNYTVTVEMNRMQGSFYANSVFLGTGTSMTSASGYIFIYYGTTQYGIWRDSSYNLISGAGPAFPIKTGTSAAIHTGLNKWNVLKIVKVGSNYTFYINNTFVHSFNDATFDPTYVALWFYCGGASTDVRTDYVYLTPGSGSDSVPGLPVNMAPGDEKEKGRINQMTGERED